MPPRFAIVEKFRGDPEIGDARFDCVGRAITSLPGTDMVRTPRAVSTAGGCSRLSAGFFDRVRDGEFSRQAHGSEDDEARSVSIGNHSRTDCLFPWQSVCGNISRQRFGAPYKMGTRA